jgi:predicted phosphodiesterase
MVNKWLARMIYLCLSDIQGNLDALRAVLATAEKRVFHKLLVAGDIVFPGAEPHETWRRLVSAGAVMVRGVSDKAIATLDADEVHPRSDHERAMLERMRKTQEELGELVLERLRRLPPTVRFPLEDGREMVLVHGSPSDPEASMTHDMDDEELLSLVGDDPADVVICGMSHVPFDREVADVRIINVGSVGQAPDGVEPGGAPMVAHATWIESTPAGLSVEQVTVPLVPESV